MFPAMMQNPQMQQMMQAAMSIPQLMQSAPEAPVGAPAARAEASPLEPAPAPAPPVGAIPGRPAAVVNPEDHLEPSRNGSNAVPNSMPELD
jgi:hypothetical protein